MIYKVIDKNSYHQNCECKIRSVHENGDYFQRFPDMIHNQKVRVMFTEHSDKCLKKSELGSNFYRYQIIDKIALWLYND